MATITGSQYSVYAPGGQQVNVVMTADGSNLPKAIAGEFNLEVITGGVIPSGLPAGYQGVAVLSDNGQTIDMAYGNWALNLTGDPTVIGGTGSDTITAGSGPALIIGGSGADLIYGGNGPDTIEGGSGADTMYGGNGPDTMYGGNGPDTMYGGNGPDTMYGGNGPDMMYGGNGPDLIYAGNGNDTIQGGSGPDTIYAGSGVDLIKGGSGPETIVGGAGNSTIQVGTGPTLIQDNGVAGHDTVVGFDQAHGDGITFAGQDTTSIDHVVATAQVSGGNTTITLPDGTSMTLVGITHIDNTFFH